MEGKYFNQAIMSDGRFSVSQYRYMQPKYKIQEHKKMEAKFEQYSLRKYLVVSAAKN